MKKIFISSLIFLSSILFAQENSPLFEDEVIIHLINYNNTLVTATATRILNQGAKWYPSALPNPYTLIEDEEFDVVTSNNINKYPQYPPVPRIFFDTEGDQNYDTKKTLAVSFYKLTFSNKNSYFYINTLSEGGIDVEITFDYGNGYNVQKVLLF